MPIYEYECLGCGKQHEIMQKITEKPLAKCPECGGKMRKKISNTSFVLKGTGWYATDYASGSRNTNGEAKGKEAAKAKPEKKEEPKKVEKTGAKETVSG